MFLSVDSLRRPYWGCQWHCGSLDVVRTLFGGVALQEASKGLQRCGSVVSFCGWSQAAVLGASVALRRSLRG